MPSRSRRSDQDVCRRKHVAYILRRVKGKREGGRERERSGINEAKRTPRVMPSSFITARALRCATAITGRRAGARQRIQSIEFRRRIIFLIAFTETKDKKNEKEKAVRRKQRAAPPTRVAGNPLLRNVSLSLLFHSSLPLSALSAFLSGRRGERSSGPADRRGQILFR